VDENIDLSVVARHLISDLSDGEAIEPGVPFVVLDVVWNIIRRVEDGVKWVNVRNLHL